jgi:hypothetical protein
MGKIEKNIEIVKDIMDFLAYPIQQVQDKKQLDDKQETIKELHNKLMSFKIPALNYATYNEIQANSIIRELLIWCNLMSKGITGNNGFIAIQYGLEDCWGLLLKEKKGAKQ